MYAYAGWTGPTGHVLEFHSSYAWTVRRKVVEAYPEVFMDNDWRDPTGREMHKAAWGVNREGNYNAFLYIEVDDDGVIESRREWIR